MEEYQVDGEVLLAHLHRVLGADEAEVATQLGDEAAEILQQGTMKIGLGVVIRQRRELVSVRATAS